MNHQVHRAIKPFDFKCSLLALAVASFGSAALADSVLMEEVIVSAQKREQNLQDVSVAITAFSGDQLEKLGAQEGLDITTQVPNMEFSTIFGEASNPTISLRGISSITWNDSWEPPVAIYQDEVYKGNPAGAAVQLFDVERVEVLRGPQGTLYGRNTTGGLVSFVSRKPTEEFDMRVNARLGSSNETIIDGAVGGQITDGVRGRIAVKSNKTDGWQKNVSTGSDRNETDTLAYRAMLEFDLSDSGSLLIDVHGSDVDQQSVGYAYMGFLEADGVTQCPVSKINKGMCGSNLFGLTGLEAVGGKFDPEHVASEQESLKTEIETFGTAATLSWDFGTWQLTSISAYEELDKFYEEDADGNAAFLWFFDNFTAEGEQLTQEVRANGTTENSKWVVGGFYYDDTREIGSHIPLFGYTSTMDQESDSWAAFGQLEYDISDQLTLIAGTRYTEETRKAHISTSWGIDVEREFDAEALTGRLGLDWRPAEDVLVYFSYSTGYKSGGFNGQFIFDELETFPVDEEEITSYEVGVKTTFADDRVRLNASAFRYKVEGFHVNAFDPSAGALGASLLLNGGDVRMHGIEAELTTQITNNFEVMLGMGWLENEIDSEIAVNNNPIDGNVMPNSPKLTFNALARYNLDLGENGSLTFQADYSWRDDHFYFIENTEFELNEAYGVANAKVAWESADEHITVEAFVENLADKEYFTNKGALDVDYGYAVWGKPRWYGVRFGYKY